MTNARRLKVAVIIPLYKAEPYLEGLFGTLGKYYREKSWVKVVAVNDHSPDASVRIVREQYPWVDLVETPQNLGFAKANNFAVQYALENYPSYFLFILNQDTEISEGCLERLIEAMERDSTIGIAHPLVLRYPKSEGLVNSAGNNISFLGYGYITYDGTLLSELPERQLKLHDVGYMAGMGFMIRTNILSTDSGPGNFFRAKLVSTFAHRDSDSCAQKLPGPLVRFSYPLFDPDYVNYHEDTDLALRVKMFGYRIVCVPGAILEHKYVSHTKTKFVQSRNVYYWIERNRFLLFAKFYTLRMLLVFLPALLVNEIGVMGYSFVQNFWRERLRVYAWALTHIPFLLHKRRGVIRTGEWEKKFLDTLVPDVQYKEVDNFALRLANAMWRIYFSLSKKILS